MKISELEQQAALKYLYSWLSHHPKYSAIAPPELSESLYYADVSILAKLSLSLIVYICAHTYLYIATAMELMQGSGHFLDT